MVITPPPTVPDIARKCASSGVQAAGLPACDDPDLAIRSLGYAACYSRVRARQGNRD